MIRIARLPDLPPMDGRRPLVLLVGSAGDWQLYAARQLESATVVLTDAPVQGVVSHEGYDPSQILDGIDLVAAVADVVLVWISSGPVWLWIEMGQWIAIGDPVCVWGIQPGESWHHAGHLRHQLIGDGRIVYSTLDDTITAARLRLQETRHDHVTTRSIFTLGAGTGSGVLR